METQGPAQKNPTFGGHWEDVPSYEPSADDGRVGYTGSPDVGFQNQYTGVHPCFFVASFLDPHIKDLLRSEGNSGNSLMTEDQHSLLKKMCWI